MKRIFIFLSGISLSAALFSQNIPEGYILQYQQDFSGKDPIGDFRSCDFQSWTVRSEGGNRFLEFNHGNEEDSAVNLPFSICLVDNYIFGDFIIEAGIMLYKDSAGGDIAVLFGIKDSVEYYSVKVPSTDKLRNYGIFVIENGPPVRLSSANKENCGLNPGKWHKIRVERNIVDTSVRVFLDDMKDPFLETKDRTYIMGYVGFGTTSGKGRIDNIKIWSQTSIPETADFLRKK